MSDKTLTTARAWRDAWAADEDGHGPPPVCPCGLPATTTDGEDEALCDGCARVCEQEWSREAAELLREGRRLVEAVPTWGAQAEAAARWLERVQRLPGVDDV